MVEQTSVGLAINTIEPHPDFLFRFRYDDPSLQRLTESIRKLGQIHNGRVVPKPDASGYRVYVGIRRYFAVKRLFDEDGDPRFGKYYAVIDEGLSAAQMLAKALAENMSERGERKDLSILEEIAIFRHAEKVLTGSNVSLVLKMLNQDEEYLKRRLSLAERISEQKLRKLYEVEQASGFEFRIGHLEWLKNVPDDRQFFIDASVIADARLKPSQTNIVEKLPEQAVSIPWFSSLFPEYSTTREGAGRPTTQVDLPSPAEIQALGEMLKKGKASPSSLPPEEEEVPSSPLSTPSSEPPKMPVYESDMMYVKCPRCSADNPCKLREKAEIIFFTPKADGVMGKESVIPKAVYSTKRECGSCGKDFFVLMSPMEGTIAAESLKTDVLKEPEPKTPMGTLDWDPSKGSWVKTLSGESSVLPMALETSS